MRYYITEAKIHDMFEQLGGIIKYAFSREGFNDLMSLRGRCCF